MFLRNALAIFALATVVLGAKGADPTDGVAGTYQAEKVENDWHYVTIRKSEPGESGDFRWENKAGVKWGCRLQLEVRSVGNGGNVKQVNIYSLAIIDGPYKDKGVQLDIYRDSDGKVTKLVQTKGGSSTWLRK